MVIPQTNSHLVTVRVVVFASVANRLTLCEQQFPNGNGIRLVNCNSGKSGYDPPYHPVQLQHDAGESLFATVVTESARPASPRI